MSIDSSKSASGSIVVSLIAAKYRRLLLVIFSIFLGFFVSVTPAFAQPIKSLEDSGCLVDGIATLQCFEVIFGNLLAISASLVVVILFVMFVIGSFMYLTSAGSPEKVAQARSTMMWAVVGTILFLGSYLILMVIQVLFLEGDYSLFDLKFPDASTPTTPSGP